MHAKVKAKNRKKKMNNKRANISTIILIVVIAIVIFNVILITALIKSGTIRIERGPKKAEPKIEDIYTIHEQLVEQEAKLDLDKKSVEKKLDQVDGSKSQIELEKEAIGNQKEHMISLFDEKLEALNKERERIKLQKAEFEEKRLKQLAKIYESMKAREAVKVFENMDVQTVADILVRMKSRNSAKILGQMRPGLASTLSEMLKGGNRKDDSDNTTK